MANSLMSIFGSLMGSSSGGGNLLMQAAGAFMRGEAPSDFMRKLAQSRPELGGIDLSDINGEAMRICREKGVDPNQLTEQIKGFLSNM